MHSTKNRKKKEVMDLRDRVAFRMKIKRKDEKPELYTIQSFQIEIIMKVLI